MDVTKPIIFDGALWPPNTLENKDVLTVGRIFYYDTSRFGMMKLIVTEVDDSHCHMSDGDVMYRDPWYMIDLTHIHLSS
jgi:hypothetical protein